MTASAWAAATGAPAAAAGCSATPHSSMGLCSKHCYSGTVDDRIAHLEKERDGLRQRNAELQGALMHLRWINDRVQRGDLNGAKQEVQSWQAGKIERQRKALMQLQKRKWTPDWIIYEDTSDFVDESHEIQEDTSDLPYLITELAG